MAITSVFTMPMKQRPMPGFRRSRESIEHGKKLAHAARRINDGKKR